MIVIHSAQKRGGWGSGPSWNSWPTVFYLTGYMYQSNSEIFSDTFGMRYNLALKWMYDHWDNASWTTVRSKHEPTHTTNVESAELIGKNKVIMILVTTWRESVGLLKFSMHSKSIIISRRR